MIIVKIMHGLGNQLFQYAVGRNLSLQLNCTLKFDISHYIKNDSCRKYELPYFYQPGLVETNLEEHIHDEFNFHNQPFFQFDKKIKKITANTFLIGFWQSEKYFSEHRELLSTDLKIKNEFVKNVETKALEMQKENSVCVHVRRSDYLLHTNCFGLLPVGYYINALKYLERKTGRFKAYLFSDDIGWVKENIPIKEEHEFVSGYISGNNIEDFYLMTNCRHHIIANSSFSWWAAWLNVNKDKIVIAPEKWFISKKYNPDDVVPDNWIKM
jgi:hypothetical protein